MRIMALDSLTLKQRLYVNHLLLHNDDDTKEIYTDSNTTSTSLDDDDDDDVALDLLVLQRTLASNCRYLLTLVTHFLQSDTNTDFILVLDDLLKLYCDDNDEVISECAKLVLSHYKSHFSATACRILAKLLTTIRGENNDDVSLNKSLVNVLEDMIMTPSVDIHAVHMAAQYLLPCVDYKSPSEKFLQTLRSTACTNTNTNTNTNNGILDKLLLIACCSTDVAKFIRSDVQIANMYIKQYLKFTEVTRVADRQLQRKRVLHILADNKLICNTYQTLEFEVEAHLLIQIMPQLLSVVHEYINDKTSSTSMSEALLSRALLQDTQTSVKVTLKYLMMRMRINHVNKYVSHVLSLMLQAYDSLPKADAELSELLDKFILNDSVRVCITEILINHISELKVETVRRCISRLYLHGDVMRVLCGHYGKLCEKLIELHPNPTLEAMASYVANNASSTEKENMMINQVYTSLYLKPTEQPSLIDAYTKALAILIMDFMSERFTMLKDENLTAVSLAECCSRTGHVCLKILLLDMSAADMDCLSPQRVCLFYNSTIGHLDDSNHHDELLPKELLKQLLLNIDPEPVLMFPALALFYIHDLQNKDVCFYLRSLRADDDDSQFLTEVSLHTFNSVALKWATYAQLFESWIHTDDEESLKTLVSLGQRVMTETEDIHLYLIDYMEYLFDGIFYCADFLSIHTNQDFLSMCLDSLYQTVLETQTKLQRKMLTKFTKVFLSENFMLGLKFDRQHRFDLADKYMDKISKLGIKGQRVVSCFLCELLYTSSARLSASGEETSEFAHAVVDLWESSFKRVAGLLLLKEDRSCSGHESKFDSFGTNLESGNEIDEYGTIDMKYISPQIRAEEFCDGKVNSEMKEDKFEVRIHSCSISRAFAFIMLKKVALLTVKGNLSGVYTSINRTAILLLDRLVTLNDRSLLLGSDEYVNLMRTWQALNALVPFLVNTQELQDGSMKKMLDKTFQCLSENLHGSIRYFVEGFLIQLSLSESEWQAMILDCLLERLEDVNVSNQTLSSLLIMIGFIELKISLPHDYLKRVTFATLPWLSATQGFSRCISQLMLHKLIPKILKDENVNITVSQIECQMLKSIHNFLENNKEMKKFRKKQLKFFMNFDLSVVSDVIHMLQLPLDCGLESVPIVPVEVIKRTLQLCYEDGEQPVWKQVNAMNEEIKLSRSPEFVQENGASDIIQRKIIPVTALELEIDGVVNEKQRNGAGQKKTDLVLCASLIDKIPNLAGLTRTCEIFAAKRIVLPDKGVTRMDNFKQMSVGAGEWIDVEECREDGLMEWLRKQKNEGYTIVGIEQTSSSECITQFEFPKRCVLLLGKEKEGIPVEFLNMVDFCIEIPQLGIIRSLNVHVSGALAIWEYAKQSQGWKK